MQGVEKRGKKTMAKLILTFNKQVIKEYPLQRASPWPAKTTMPVVIDNWPYPGTTPKATSLGKYILTDLQKH